MSHRIKLPIALGLGIGISLCVSLGSLALAGPNADGYLLLHTDDTVIYTADDINEYCFFLQSECPFDFECDDDNSTCIDALLNGIGVTSGRGPETAMIWAVAAFPDGACPRVQAVQFGLSWDVTVTMSFVDWGSCGGFELTTDGWPTEQNTGTAVTWAAANPKLALPVYWFAAYSYYGPVELSVADFPVGQDGAAFADDSVPAVLDPILPANWGSVGLNGASGWNPYDPGELSGACCLADNTCLIASNDECESAGGEYLGDGISCEPNPCIVPTIENSWGQIKGHFRN